MNTPSATPALADAAGAAPSGSEAPPRVPPAVAMDEWDQLGRRLARLLRREADAAWVQELQQLADSLLALQQRDPDLALYLLLHAAAHELDSYSAQHAMACAVVADLAAAWLGWTEDERRSGRLAALSMNVSMTSVQDSLAREPGQPSDDARELIAGHAAQSEALLRKAGVTDPLWLEAVLHHHRRREHTPAEGALPPGERIAELLRRVDVYTAKLSRRRSREAASPALAARDACLDASGQPDSIGATLLRVLGLYPPGTFVELANGELAVVVARGEKAHTPLVAAIRRTDGSLLMQPSLRDTALRKYAVSHGVRAASVRVRLNHLRVLVARHGG
jgi:hypothetical protein